MDVAGHIDPGRGQPGVHGGQFDAGKLAERRAAEGQIPSLVVPVSYTHLDVYKRQPPLRVTVSSAYGEAHWTPRTTTAIPSQSPVLPRPPGLSDQVPRVESHLSVSQTSLGKPYVASPVPVVWGTVVGARWNVDEASGCLLYTSRCV